MGKDFPTGVLTISDKGSQGKRVDESGKTAVSLLQGAGFSVVQTKIVPDDREQITRTLIEWAEKDCLSLGALVADGENSGWEIFSHGLLCFLALGNHFLGQLGRKFFIMGKLRLKGSPAGGQGV